MSQSSSEKHYLARRPFQKNGQPFSAEEEYSIGCAELFRNAWLKSLVSSLQAKAQEYNVDLCCMLNFAVIKIILDHY